VPLTTVGSNAVKDLGLICNSPSVRTAGILSASAQGDTLCTLERNAETGYLKITQTIQDSRYLRGAIAARVSPDGRYVAVVSCHASSLILFVRDPESGVLVAVDMVLTEDLKDRPLNFPTDCEFSPDSRFLYVITGRSNAVSAFKVVEPGKLEWIDTKVGPNGVFGNMRGIVFSPDGQSIYLASVQGNSLVTMTRDLQSGKMEFLQTIKDGEMGITGLSGSFDVTCSPDGIYGYVCSGRFGGDSAVLAFKVGEDRRLSFLQEILGAPDGPLNYRGGVAIVITQDGRRIFASATLSSTLACFVADPETGRLNLLQTLTPDPKNPRLLNVPNGIACTPDGKFLYITSDDNAIAVYKWNVNL
jgi:6-phosphogluconolactonase (cycloisomerase 2 family)